MRRRAFVAPALLAAALGCDLVDFDPRGDAGSVDPPLRPTLPPAAGSDAGALDGGAGGPPDSHPDVGSVPAPAPGDQPLPDVEYCRPISAATAAQVALERQILELTNATRARGVSCGGRPYPPVGALTMDPALRCAARAHSKDMIDRRFFDHTNPSGEGPLQRVAKTGFQARAWGENIAGGNETPQQTMQQWLTSPGHCVNMMNGAFRLLGVGYRSGGNYRHYWTQVFGTAR